MSPKIPEDKEGRISYVLGYLEQVGLDMAKRGILVHEIFSAAIAYVCQLATQGIEDKEEGE